jgi:enoyl-CoA hydratase/carnithine racemase
MVCVDNPASPVNTLPPQALEEFRQALRIIERDERIAFVVCHDAPKKNYAGADVTLFAGDIDPEAVRRYLFAGVELDLQIKALSAKKRTVSILRGERYGGAVEWPLMAEYSLCTPETGIRFSEVNIGLIPGWDGVLNAALRSGANNAFYLAATGRRIGAEEMRIAGLVHGIADEGAVMEQALDLAARPDSPPLLKPEALSACGATERILAECTDPSRYRDLVEDVRRKTASGELSLDAESGDNFAGKYINRRLSELGRPLAPLAVQAVVDFFARHPQMDRRDLEMLRHIAYDEAERCFGLMQTQDRRTGIASVLSHDPLAKIPLFVGA